MQLSHSWDSILQRCNLQHVRQPSCLWGNSSGRKYLFFIRCFYAIMHRTTIVQNKIISIICSCLFVCPAKNILKCYQKNLSKNIYYNYSLFFFENQASYRCWGVFADVNTIYFTSLRWIMNVWSGFETLKTQLLENAFKYYF